MKKREIRRRPIAESTRNVDIFKRAAEIMAAEKETCACYAIHTASDFDWTLADKFTELFQPDESICAFWGDCWPEEIRLNCRVTALLFAAAMAATGDL